MKYVINTLGCIMVVVTMHAMEEHSGEQYDSPFYLKSTQELKQIVQDAQSILNMRPDNDPKKHKKEEAERARQEYLYEREERARQLIAARVNNCGPDSYGVGVTDMRVKIEGGDTLVVYPGDNCFFNAPVGFLSGFISEAIPLALWATGSLDDGFIALMAFTLPVTVGTCVAGCAGMCMRERIIARRQRIADQVNAQLRAEEAEERGMHVSVALGPDQMLIDLENPQEISDTCKE